MITNGWCSAFRRSVLGKNRLKPKHQRLMLVPLGSDPFSSPAVDHENEMAVFSYTGIDRESSTVHGTIAADSPRQARDQFAAKVCVSVSCRRPSPRRDETGCPKSLCDRPRRSGRRRSMSCRCCYTPAFRCLTRSTRWSSKTAVRFARRCWECAIASRPELRLPKSLRERPDLFDDASIHMVEVGENSGTLDAVLEQLADFKQKQLKLKDSISTALAYPVFLIVFGTGAGLFLMTSVLPPLLENLEETVDELPFPTRVAKAISDTVISYGWLLAILAVVAVFVIVAMLRSERGKRIWHRTLLRLPLIGPIAVKQGVSRIAMIIGTLSRSGVELTRAVELAERSTSNLIFKEALRECGERIAAGEEVAEALQRSEAFPPLAVRVFSVGQDSGKLDEMLFRLSEDYDSQVATASARFTALLEPALILVLAVMVGFLLLATILPILEAGNVM